MVLRVLRRDLLVPVADLEDEGIKRGSARIFASS